MENTQTPFKAGLNTGLVLGLVSIVLTFLAYFIDPSLMVAWYFGLGVLVIYFGLLIYQGKQYRNSLGGFIEFGPAFNFNFIALVVAGFIGIIGNTLLYTVVDPALPGVLVDTAMENQLAMLEKLGAADAMSNEQLDVMRSNMESAYSVAGQFKAFGLALILYAIIALILGAIIKKRDKSLDY